MKYTEPQVCVCVCDTRVRVVAFGILHQLAGEWIIQTEHIRRIMNGKKARILVTKIHNA